MTFLFVARRAIAAGLLLGLPHLAAQVSLDLSAPVPGSVGSTPLPAGPLPFPQYIVDNSSAISGFSAEDGFVGQASPTAFWLNGSVSAFAAASSGFGTSGSDSSSGSVVVILRLTFTSPTPYSGVLRLDCDLNWSSYSTSSGFTTESASGYAFADIDIDADGTIDHSFPGIGGVVELPVAFQSTLVVDVSVSVGQSVYAYATYGAFTWATGAAGLALRGELLDVVVQEYATTGASVDLDFVQHPNGDLELSVNDLTGATMNGLIAIGLQPVVVALQPNVTQLVSADIVAPVGQLTVPLPRLPSGLELYVQGFGLTTGGAWTSTRSLQVRWF